MSFLRFFFWLSLSEIENQEKGPRTIKEWFTFANEAISLDFVLLFLGQLYYLDSLIPFLDFYLLKN